MIDIISSLNKSEIQLFKSTLNSNKLILLFTAYLKEQVDQFKSNSSGNSYYVYEKRLREKLYDFIANRTIELNTTEEIAPLRLLIAARKLLLQENNTEGRRALKLAEKKAIEISHFGLLNEIYQTEIQYSFNLTEAELLDIHRKLVNNNELFMRQEKLNLAYAVLKENVSNTNTAVKGVKNIFDEILAEFNLAANTKLNFKQLYQLVEIVNLNAIQNKSFHATSLFFINHLKSIQNTKLDNRDSAPYHVKILLAIANILFRKKDFPESLSVINEAEELVVKYQTQLSSYSKSILLLKCLNLNFIGEQSKAAQLLDEYFMQNQSSEKYYNLILLRCMIHIQQSEIKQALKKLNILEQTDKWVSKHIGFESLMNKKYMEIIIHIELENLDLVDSRIKALLRSYKTYFVKNESFQVIPFLKLVNEYIKSPQIIKSEGFKNKIERTIISKPNNSEDLFFICFYAWLKAKITNTNTYDATLALLN